MMNLSLLVLAVLLAVATSFSTVPGRMTRMSSLRMNNNEKTYMCVFVTLNSYPMAQIIVRCTVHPFPLLQRSMIKPDGVQRGVVGNIIGRFEAKGFQLKALKLVTPTESLLKEHYQDLTSKPFFPALLAYMLSGRCSDLARCLLCHRLFLTCWPVHISYLQHPHPPFPPARAGGGHGVGGQERGEDGPCDVGRDKPGGLCPGHHPR